MRFLNHAVCTLGLAFLVVSAPAAGQGSPGWAIANAEAAADAVETLRDDPGFAPLFLDPGITKRIQQAHARLALAKDSLSDAHSRYGGSQAYEFGLAAERDFRAIERELWTRRERQQAAEAHGNAAGDRETAARRQLLAEIDALVLQGREVLARPASSWPMELASRADLGRALKAAEGANLSMPAESLRRIRGTLGEAGTTARYAYRTWPSMDPLRPAAGWIEPPRRRPVPDRLRSAVQAFLAGDYRRAVDLLAVVEDDDAGAGGLAHLIRGAAAYSLFVESGERDRALLDRALADARACRGGDPAVTPARDAFSPRYVALFDGR